VTFEPDAPSEHEDAAPSRVQVTFEPEELSEPEQAVHAQVEVTFEPHAPSEPEDAAPSRVQVTFEPEELSEPEQAEATMPQSPSNSQSNPMTESDEAVIAPVQPTDATGDKKTALESETLRLQLVEKLAAKKAAALAAATVESKNSGEDSATPMAHEAHEAGPNRRQNTSWSFLVLIFAILPMGYVALAQRHADDLQASKPFGAPRCSPDKADIRVSAEVDTYEEDMKTRLHAATTHSAGSRVEVFSVASGQWFSGAVSTVHDDGAVDIQYDDGDAQSRVPLGLIRRQKGRCFL